MSIDNITNGIKEQIASFEKEVSNYSHFSEIKKRMESVQEKIGCRFQNLSFLMLAFCRTKNPDEKNDYKNESLAQIGDFVLTLMLAEFYFSQGKGKKEIQSKREEISRNTNLYKFSERYGLMDFCYHEFCFYNSNCLDHEKVSVNQHDSIVEAIIGAIYLDSGLDKAREWIHERLL